MNLYRNALARAWPSMALAALVLLPFLNTPFTIDDPLYLREAQHVLVDPLHPQAFSMVWSLNLNLRASQILPGGVAVPYLLVPTALAGCAEWAGHLTTLLLLLAAVYATALTALRLGLNDTQARLAALLTATCPAVLGMSATVMPDIPTMFFVVLGMERLIAWRDDRRWHQALLATLWLTLAPLTRVHAIVILPAAFVLLLDGITRDEIRSSFRNPVRFLPLLLIPVCFLAASAFTADPHSDGENIVMSSMESEGRRHLIAMNGSAFLAHFLLVIPLTIPWLVLRARELPKTLWLVAILVGGVLYVRLGWVAFAAAATVVVLLDISWDAIVRRDRTQLALWLWLFLAVPVVMYIHLPSKYLLPSVPAAVILIARRQAPRWLIPAMASAGLVYGMLILMGIRDLADTQRRAVADLIVPHTNAFERVWFAGHWGFQWYAEAAGARPFTMEPPYPTPGDILVHSAIDVPLSPKAKALPKVLRQVSYPNRFGRVMDANGGAGFFSSGYGYLPWVPGSGEANTFSVWRAE